MSIPQAETPVWTLVSERPAHLVPPGHGDSTSFLVAQTAKTAERVGRNGPSAEQTWGKQNRVALFHPMGAFPLMSELYDFMPFRGSGGEHMPRFQVRAYGATQRMVVAPGREENGIFHMPGGQSGHPSSPYYRKGHCARMSGEPTPFLPGPTR